jgi:hypothetical protein
MFHVPQVQLTKNYQCLLCVITLHHAWPYLVFGKVNAAVIVRCCVAAQAAYAWPLVARALQPGGTRRLGILKNKQDDAEGKAQLSGFTQTLAGLGWIEGRNLQTQVRWGCGDVKIAQARAVRTYRM